MMFKGKYVNRSKTVPEILTDAASFDDNSDKVEFLKLCDNNGLRFIVSAMYELNWRGISVPKYRKSTFPIGNNSMTINNSVKRLMAAYALKTTQPERSQKLLLLVLENVHAKEAELIEHVIKGGKVEGVSKAVFRQVYPDMFRSEQED